MAGTTVYAWDPSGNLSSIIDARGNKSTYEYDVLRRKTSQTDALGGTRRWTYDASGNILTTTDERGYTSTLTYDLLSRITSSTNALGFRRSLAGTPVVTSHPS